jgi:ABC-type transport system involved in cytochrome c biogenesis ATPase subunit
MSEHRRTAIRKLSVRRYRSLSEVVLDDLPEIIVLYGPNGAGKSNILRAVQLVLRAASLPAPLPMKREEAVVMTLPEADKALALRPDDFRFGDLPEIRVSLEIELGTRAREILSLPSERTLSRLDLTGIFQLDSDKAVRFWFERAHADASPLDTGALKEQLMALRQQEERHDTRFRFVKTILDSREEQAEDPDRAELRRSYQASLSELQQQKEAVAERYRALTVAARGDVTFIAEQVQRVLIPRLLQLSGAYRVPGGAEDPQDALYQAFLSENPRERDAARRLGQRLASAGLFGAPAEGVALLPVDSRTYGEKQIRFKHPTHGELPLRNLGSGEQQVVFMLGQRVITPYPIAHVEEPEAHLHKTLMEPLARVLRDSVSGNGGVPDVDQLWMATHHHYFAIAPEFFDVSIDERGATQIARRKRDEAVKHFYEPSPYWDTLRGLVESGMSPDTVVSLDEEGQPIRAKDVLASIDGDRRVANAFVESATRAFVLSLTKDEPAT